MSPKRKKPKSEKDPLDPYRQVRKPMPPPSRVNKDKRREMDEDRAEREMDENK